VIGALSIDIEAKRVTANGIAVDLTVREWALLELFLTRPGRVLSKDFIGQQLFNYDDHLSINTIEVYVSRLRAKIEAAGLHIRTVRGFGYLWEQLDA
jgi:DNA-binding response OmpR family regulator